MAVRPANQKLKGGERISFALSEPKAETGLQPTPLEFPIVFEDESIIVIDKPCGLVVHPGAGDEKNTVVSMLLSHTCLSSIGAPLRPGIVSRLDRETSGLMILAKTDKAHVALVESFSGHSLTKEYLAIAQGRPVPDRGTIRIAIDRDRVDRKRMRAVPPNRGKMAVSHYEVLRVMKTATLVKVAIETGRTHQIRVHMSYIGHPLVGDTRYGGSGSSFTCHFLHSHRLSLPHPVMGTPMTWVSEPPPAFANALVTLS